VCRKQSKPVFDSQIDDKQRSTLGDARRFFSPGGGQRTLTTEPKSIPLQVDYEADLPDDRAVISGRVRHDRTLPGP